MEFVINLGLLCIAFVFLIKGADAFVDGASDVSARLKIPPLIIGLTVVSFGTSAPELAVSTSAAIAGNNGIAAGNVVGSNIFNLLMVAGISAIFSKIPVSKSIVKKDYPFMIAISLATLCLFFDGNGSTLSHGDGLILLIFFGIFLTYTIQSALKARNDEAEEEQRQLMSGVKCALCLILGVAGIVVGGQLAVNSASALATMLGMSDTLVGLTVVALGTSLPELVTSVVASRKGENDISIGNVVGSNIFNLGLVLGLSTAIHPIGISGDIVIDTALMLAFSLVVMIPIMRKRELSRGWGIFMVLCYCGYLAYIIMRNYGILFV